MDRVYLETKLDAGDDGAIEGKAWDFSKPDRVGDMIEQLFPFENRPGLVRTEAARLPTREDRAEQPHFNRSACQARWSAMKVEMK